MYMSTQRCGRGRGGGQSRMCGVARGACVGGVCGWGRGGAEVVGACVWGRVGCAGAVRSARRGGVVRPGPGAARTQRVCRSGACVVGYACGAVRAVRERCVACGGDRPGPGAAVRVAQRVQHRARVQHRVKKCGAWSSAWSDACSVLCGAWSGACCAARGAARGAAHGLCGEVRSACGRGEMRAMRASERGERGREQVSARSFVLRKSTLLRFSHFNRFYIC